MAFKLSTMVDLCMAYNDTCSCSWPWPWYKVTLGQQSKKCSVELSRLVLFRQVMSINLIKLARIVGHILHDLDFENIYMAWPTCFYCRWLCVWSECCKSNVYIVYFLHPHLHSTWFSQTAHTCTHSCMHACKHTHTILHTTTHTHTHTHTHTYTRSNKLHIICMCTSWIWAEASFPDHRWI